MTRRDALAFGMIAGAGALGATPGVPIGDASADRLEAPPWVADHLGLIRRNPEAFPFVFGVAADSFRAALGDEFDGITRDGSIAAFASVVAHCLAPYGPSVSSSPADMLASSDLNCGNYPILAAFLFRIARPISPVRLRWVGWDRGTFGNHGHLVAEGAGVPLFLDPTLAIVARAGMDDLRAGTPVGRGRIKELARWRYAAPAKDQQLDVFRANVVRALAEGLFPRSQVLFDGHADLRIVRH